MKKLKKAVLAEVIEIQQNEGLEDSGRKGKMALVLPVS